MTYIALISIQYFQGENTPCEPSPCQNGGNCDDSNPPAGSKYVCTCIAGFSGDRCESKLNR